MTKEELISIEERLRQEKILSRQLSDVGEINRILAYFDKYYKDDPGKAIESLIGYEGMCMTILLSKTMRVALLEASDKVLTNLKKLYEEL